MIINVPKITLATKLIRVAFKKYKSRLILMIGLGFVGGLAGGIGIGAIIPLFYLINDATVDQEINIVTRAIDSFFSFLHLPMNPTLLLVFIVLLFLIKALITFSAKYINEKTSAEFEEEMRSDLYKKTLNTSWSFLQNQKIGYLEKSLLFDIDRSSGIFVQVSTTVLISTSLIAYAFVAFNISAIITLATLGFGLLLFFFFKPIFYKTRILAETIGIANKGAGNHVNEHMIGAKNIKASSVESIVTQKGSDYFSEIKNSRIKTEWYRNVTSSFLEPIGMVFIAIMFLITYDTPGFNIASFAVVVYLVQKMFSFIQSAQGQLHGINGLIPYLKSTIAFRETIIANRENNEGTDKFEFSNSIDLKNLNFSYGLKKKIINDVSFSIKKNEMIGIIGPSGTGKTTIVDLLLRFFNLDSGSIKIDGKSIANIEMTQWRKHIGYVPQETFLLNDTIENNIRFYNDKLTKQDLIEAAKIANIYETIQKLPEKMQTIVGERGTKLSGGQRQRVALARIIAQSPDILILDEATSSLDAESEKLIQEAIGKLKNKITIMIIAHRLSTIENCDTLIVIKDGRVVERGIPSELKSNQSSYFHKMQVKKL